MIVLSQSHALFMFLQVYHCYLVWSFHFSGGSLTHYSWSFCLSGGSLTRCSCFFLSGGSLTHCSFPLVVAASLASTFVAVTSLAARKCSNFFTTFLPCNDNFCVMTTLCYVMTTFCCLLPLLQYSAKLPM